MQHLEGSGTPVLYIGRTVLKGYRANYEVKRKGLSADHGRLSAA